MSDTVILNKRNPAVKHLISKDKRLAKVIDMVGEIRYTPHSENPYCFLIHEIIEQMLSVKAGAKIYGRLEELCDGKVTPTSITNLSDEEIRSIGTSGTKAMYIRGVTDVINSGQLDLDELPNLSDEEVIKKLTALKGIGTWTAKMYLIFVLDRQDVLPYEDVAFLQSFEWMHNTSDRTRDNVEKKCKKWKPYTSVAARYLYHALDMGLTKNKFHLYNQ